VATRRRIDSLLVEKGLVESRAKAQALIMAGEVVPPGSARLLNMGGITRRFFSSRAPKWTGSKSFIILSFRYFRPALVGGVGDGPIVPPFDVEPQAGQSPQGACYPVEVMVSTLAISPAVSFHLAAAALADTWSAFRAPAMTLLTHGLASSQAIASFPTV